MSGRGRRQFAHRESALVKFDDDFDRDDEFALEERSGVALVVTLILLAVITTLAIAFIAVTHRETSAVQAVQSTTDAENAGDLALERAKAEILARFIVGNNREIAGPGLMVSQAGDQNRFEPNPPGPSGAYRDPSPPVFVNTNLPGQNGSLEDRFYLDLNRNHYFDESGLVPFTTDQVDAQGRYTPMIDPTSGLVLTNWVVGDPMWVGVLARQFAWHTNDNPYISRYAWLVMPVGQSLDANAIHNQAINVDMRAGFNGFYRNQGNGAWECNLSGLLVDLNTNAWNRGNPYQYNPLNYSGNPIPTCFGDAFNDARELLTYRYSPGNYPDLLDPAINNNPAVSLFPGGVTAAILGQDGLDYYSRLPVRLLPNDRRDTDADGGPWPGARNRRNFYTLVHDLWDARKLPDPNGFRSRLAAVSTLGDSYDRYTYYRLLSQMGTDSSAEDDRINVNYVNLGSWQPKSAFRYEATEMIPWNTRTPQFVQAMGRKGPELFFLSAVRRMFFQDTNFAAFVTPETSLPNKPLRIPVFTNGSPYFVHIYGNGRTTNSLYSGRVHQILQQAANIYDATRDYEPDDSPGQHAGMFPTIFRPRFDVEGDDVYIVDYVMVDPQAGDTPQRFMGLGQGGQWRDLELGEKPRTSTAAASGSDDMVYNVPMIVGARKGFPNFNEFTTRTAVLATRRLDAQKSVGETDINKFRFTETLDLCITNDIGFEAWNSYVTSTYPRNVQLYFTNRVIAEVRRDNTIVRTLITGNSLLPPWNILANTWKPATKTLDQGYLSTNFPGRILLCWTNVAPITSSGPEHNWTVSVRNQLRFFIVDNNRRLIDIVGLSVTNQFFDVGRQLRTDWEEAPTASRIWSQGQLSGKNWRQGIEIQLNVSQGNITVSPDVWRNYAPTAPNRDDGTRAFREFILSQTATGARVPFTPSRVMYQTNVWRANDPLVHYTAEDLFRGSGVTNASSSRPMPRIYFGTRNPEYSTWADSRRPELRDPAVKSSDNWNFPTNKVPTVGWLGRVHRGTPWQTVYFKSDAAGEAPWLGNNNSHRPPDTSLAMHPTNDWRLVDIFTASGHPNAARGRLSINQTNAASWSAVLSGLAVNAATNSPVEDVAVIQTYTNIVTPAALSDPTVADSTAVQTIVDGINRVRARRQFRHLSEFLSVPELTMASPLLTANGSYNARSPQDARVTDSDYEAIPEKILGLIKAGDQRYVIYSWGQSLKPAEFGVERQGTKLIPRGPAVETAGSNRGMPKNYQITGEYATRTVVRIEFDRISNDPANPLYNEFNYGRPHAVVESFNIIPPE